ncbi:MAG TPA: hypothetical protein VHB48_16795 [Chitinophagaceae bacterium]|nr:hypothetical protein [Chitinophagaceae bacterium]
MLPLQRLARGCTIIVFLALIRCIAEVPRLQYYTPGGINWPLVRPFILGAMVTSAAALAMVILLFYKLPRIAIVIAVCTIAALFVLKFMYDIKN